jgi:hypothetical protein
MGEADRFTRAADAARLGGRVKPGHDMLGLAALPGDRVGKFTHGPRFARSWATGHDTLRIVPRLGGPVRRCDGVPGS